MNLEDLYNEYPDNKLVNKWLEGDKYAALALIKRYYKIAIPYCIKKYGLTRGEAKDLVQQTFLRITNKIQVKRHGIDNFRPFLMTSLANNYYEVYRNKKRKKEVGIELAAYLNCKDQSIEKFVTQDEFEILQKNLTSLQRQSFLFKLEGYKIYEIAEMTGQTRVQVRGQLERARKKLRELFRL